MSPSLSLVASGLAVIRWNVDPVMFRLGSLAPRWYGLLFGIGFLLSFYAMRSIFLREGKPEHDVDTLLYWILGGTVIGARLGHVLFYDPGYYLTHPGQILQVWEGGLASHGGFIGVLTALYLYARSRPGQPFLWLLDRIAMPAALTGGLIRLGNLFNSEILGTPTDVPWAFIFELRDMTPRHPAQLYESLSYFAICGILVWLYRRSDSSPRFGTLSGAFMVLVFGSRFMIEFVKAQQAHFELGLSLTMGQLLSIPVVAFGIWLLWSSRSRPSQPPEA
ncbi:prolipoprotein diacylglyceryl transferase [Longibacter salinarum]|uniref:Phosphatidylglycerol--prolipoprotein diacylglyceryl transferase n=1 Tax=Longibacter salinarum TaxID=1850348 RepID=A0A2A8D1C7_9BACT|nr:prolipoprotein diacylglyceryl transferase [Longibacter salinarum]PEN14448.1 prolipoprotein diacylglyceryl transferase [Longibacter salinarum]